MNGSVCITLKPLFVRTGIGLPLQLQSVIHFYNTVTPIVHQLRFDSGTHAVVDNLKDTKLMVGASETTVSMRVLPNRTDKVFPWTLRQTAG